LASPHTNKIPDPGNLYCIVLNLESTLKKVEKNSQPGIIRQNPEKNTLEF
jgi:hypothetical protein